MKKKESEKIQQTAQQIVSDFGIERLDSLPVSVANDYKMAMRKHLSRETGVVYQTAKEHIAKACRCLRNPDANPKAGSGWGGPRDGAGKREKPSNA